MGLDDAKIGEQQGDGTRGHGRSAIGMDGELTVSDVTLTEKVTLPTVPPWTLSCPSAQVIDCVKHTSSFRFTGSESPECPCKQVCVFRTLLQPVRAFIVYGIAADRLTGAFYLATYRPRVPGESSRALMM